MMGESAKQAAVPQGRRFRLVRGPSVRHAALVYRVQGRRQGHRGRGARGTVGLHTQRATTFRLVMSYEGQHAHAPTPCQPWA